MKKKLKSKKYVSKKRSSFKTKLGLIIAALLIFLGGSIYLAFTSGTGPLSALLQTGSINRLAPEDIAEIQLECKGTVNPMTGACKPKTVTTPKPTPKSTPKNEGNGVNIAERNCDARNSATQTCVYGATCICTPKTTPPPAGTSPKVCNVNTGVNIEAGKYAATGYGLDEKGNRCTQNGCSARECVEIKADCSHGPSVKCHEQNAKTPGSVIMPPSAGPEYTTGMTPTQVKEAEAKGVKLPDKPKEQCYDKNASGVWVIVVDGSTKSGDAKQKCNNGEFIPATTYDAAKEAEKKATCELDQKKAYDSVHKTCNLKVVLPTDAEKKKKAEECRGKNQEYDSNKNACGKTLKCGTGYVERAGFCDLAPGSSSENVRENIISSGEKFCKSIGKQFEINTGLCIGVGQTPSTGRPRECTPSSSNISGTNFAHRWCKVEGGVVTNERYITCDTNTSIYDPKTGICNRKPVVPATNINPQGKQSTPVVVGNNSNFCASNYAFVVTKENVYVSSNECGTPGCNPSSGKCNSTTTPPKTEVTQPVAPVKTVQKPSDCPPNTTPSGVPGSYGGAWNCVPYKVYSIEDNKSDKVLKVGESCTETGKTNCNNCPNNIATLYETVGGSDRWMCGNKTTVAETLKEKEIRYSNIVDDNTKYLNESKDNIGKQCNVGQFDCSKCDNDGIYTDNTTVITSTGSNGKSESKTYCGTESQVKEAQKVHVTTPAEDAALNAAEDAKVTDSVPVATTTKKVVGDNTDTQTMDMGTKCLTAGSCTRGCKGGVYTEVEAKYDGKLLSDKEYYCGDKKYVDESLKDMKITNGTQTVVSDNKSEQTLNPGDLCSNAAVFNKIKCIEKCPDGVYTTVSAGTASSVRHYCGTKEENADKAVSAIVPASTKPADGSLKPGDLCENGTDSSCDSGICSKGIKPGETKSKWYCVPNTNINSSSTYTDAFTPQVIKGGNGYPCSGSNDKCVSGFCQIKTGVIFGWIDRCADSPFASANTPTAKEVHIDNLQTKYTLIKAQNPNAFITTPYGCVESASIACVPVPGHPGEFMNEDYILDKAREYKISLPGDDR